MQSSQSASRWTSKPACHAQADDKSRGYTPLAEQTLDPANQTRPDTKESYYIWCKASSYKSA